MLINNGKEMLIYKKYIKPCLKKENDKNIMEAADFIELYMSLKEEEHKNILVDLLNRNSVVFVNNKNIDRNYNNTEDNVYSDNTLDDYSITDEYIEEEILSHYQKYVSEEDQESLYIDDEQIDSIGFSEIEKQYIKGYIDGRNFELGRQNTSSIDGKIVYMRSSSTERKQYELKKEIDSIKMVLNDLERTIIDLAFDYNLSLDQIKCIVNLQPSEVEIIYKKALMKLKNNQNIGNIKQLMKSNHR